MVAENRESREAALLDGWTRLPNLDSNQDVQIRYYESLQEPNLRCKEAARVLIDALGLKAAHNADLQVISNQVVQSASECGWYALHYAEVELRRWRGEGQWALWMSADSMAARLQTVIQKILDSRSQLINN